MPESPESESSVVAHASSSRGSHRWWALHPAGSLVGLCFALLSVTPSLLPRPAVLQGVLAALAFALGYLLGTVLWALVRHLLARRGHSISQPRWWWPLYAGLWIAAIAGLSASALQWQNEVRRLVAMPPLEGTDLSAFLLAFLPFAALLLLVGKGTLRLFRRWSRRAGPARAGAATTLVVVGGLAALALTAWIAVESIFLELNGQPEADVQEPASDFRSAGPESAIAWDSLGRHGSAFVGGGPTAQEIAELSGQDAIEPIRVYAGVKSAADLDDRADLVVAELERTGAFDREVLLVATTTGSGWLEPQTVDALEYLHGGDTAIASMQYAFTPSWVSFLFDPDAPVDASRALFEAVETRWSELPEDDRPLLVTYGLSLGAHGGQAVFADLADLRANTDGALFVGSPNSSELWRTLQASRDTGSPAWQPVLDQGREVRWMSRAGDEARLSGPWETPPVLYLQHATDPVTWLSPDLILSSPDWLEPGQRSPDVSPSMRWMPFVTALQVSIDMLGGEAVPAQYGHNYGDVVVTAWQQVTGDSGLDAAAIERLQAEIATYARIPVFEE